MYPNDVKIALIISKQTLFLLFQKEIALIVSNFIWIPFNGLKFVLVAEDGNTKTGVEEK